MKVELATGTERKSVRLIDSITQLPYCRVSEGEAFVITGAAMNEIVEELRRLWDVREAIAEMVRTSKDAPSG